MSVLWRHHAGWSAAAGTQCKAGHTLYFIFSFSQRVEKKKKVQIPLSSSNVCHSHSAIVFCRQACRIPLSVLLTIAGGTDRATSVQDKLLYIQSAHTWIAIRPVPVEPVEFQSIYGRLKTDLTGDFQRGLHEFLYIFTCKWFYSIFILIKENSEHYGVNLFLLSYKHIVWRWTPRELRGEVLLSLVFW